VAATEKKGTLLLIPCVMGAGTAAVSLLIPAPAPPVEGAAGAREPYRTVHADAPVGEGLGSVIGRALEGRMSHRDEDFHGGDSSYARPGSSGATEAEVQEANTRGYTVQTQYGER
jgi:hypothetical protein